MNNPSHSPAAHRSRWREFALALVMVGVLLAVLRLQGERYHTNPLALDEAWNIDAAQYGILSADIHAPLYPLLLKVWLALAGDSTLAVRWLSSLLCLLTIAVVYRLAADLFDARAGLFAALIMASWSYFVYYGVLARPFALVAFLSALTILVFVRWMKAPTDRLSIPFGISALALINTHSFGVYLLIALAVISFFVVHKRSKLIRLSLVFVAFILLNGLSLLMQSNVSANVSFNTASLWGLALTPDALFNIVLPLGNYAVILLILSAAALVVKLLLGIASRENLVPYGASRWLVVPLFAAAGIMFCCSSLVEMQQIRRPLQPIDFALLIPLLAILLAYGIAKLPTMFGGALLIIYVVSGARQLPDALEETPPYREVVDYLQSVQTADEPILVDFGPRVRDYALFEYYFLAANLSPENLTFAHTWSQSAWRFRVFPLRYNYLTDDRESISRIIQGAPRLISVSWYENDFDRYLLGILERYDVVRSAEYGPIRIHEYFRQAVPGDGNLLFSFDDTFVLARADFPTSVPACSGLDVTTWWTLRGQPADNYSMGLYLQDAGGVTQAQADGSPAGIETLTWQQERVYPDQRSLTVPCAPGRYDIRVTLYQPFTVTNLPITDADGEPIGTVATLGSIEVTP